MVCALILKCEIGSVRRKERTRSKRDLTRDARARKRASKGSVFSVGAVESKDGCVVERDLSKKSELEPSVRTHVFSSLQVPLPLFEDSHLACIRRARHSVRAEPCHLLPSDLFTVLQVAPQEASDRSPLCMEREDIQRHPSWVNHLQNRVLR